jgi:hypothetical protein
MVDVVEELKSLASVDIFKQGRDSDTFIGRPFYFDYAKTKALVNDKWKARVGGIPVGAFLLASYEAEPDVQEMVLVRVLGPTSLPTDSDVIASMVDYYKETSPGADESHSKLDTFTKYEFQFSGLECRILGTFYRETGGRTVFGADIDNFYSSHNYSLFKPAGRVLEYIVNFREGEGIPGGDDQVRLGEVRYSASRRHTPENPAPVYVSALDFVGKRTALFGMTRTGKSNTVKKIIEATVSMSERGVELNGEPLEPVGQVIFDVNGEYANANQQDQGTAIFELFDDQTTRYSLLDKEGFEVMKLNFYRDIEGGFGLIDANLAASSVDYIASFLSVDLSEPDTGDHAAHTRWERVVAAYKACLYAAGFPIGMARIRFQGRAELNAMAGGIDPSKGMSGDEAVTWFSAVWEKYASDPFFANYRNTKGREWADEDLKAMLIMLTRKKTPGGGASVSGYRKLQKLKDYHTPIETDSFEAHIVKQVREGRIVIVDLSQGDPQIQKTYSERICRRVFDDAMDLFVKNEASNYVQLYFEEAHNLFPKRDDKDLSQIYNRIAKEGAKMRLGLIYATQEPSSVSSNVLKNTQNWFVSHLNNTDELHEIEKYYDFGDFSEGLRRAADRGFIRMKTYSNSFIVPVQIDRFVAAKEGS